MQNRTEVCKIAQIDRITCHALRAIFESNALAAGVNPKILSTLAGHADIALDVKLYGHSYKDDLKNAMDIMNERMRKQA